MPGQTIHTEWLLNPSVTQHIFGSIYEIQSIVNFFYLYSLPFLDIKAFTIDAMSMYLEQFSCIHISKCKLFWIALWWIQRSCIIHGSSAITNFSSNTTSFSSELSTLQRRKFCYQSILCSTFTLWNYQAFGQSKPVFWEEVVYFVVKSGNLLFWKVLVFSSWYCMRDITPNLVLLYKYILSQFLVASFPRQEMVILLEGIDLHMYF